jgi:hypothetical protein
MPREHHRSDVNLREGTKARQGRSSSTRQRRTGPFRLLPILFIAFAFPLAAQTQDTTKAPDRPAPEAGFIDRDGNGIDDRTEPGKRRMHRRTDRFIDQDGDGICDDRQGGMGFRRKGQGLKSPGTEGGGKKSGPGGKK